MALEGATIVSQHIIDDSGLREGLMRNETMVREGAIRMARAARAPGPLFAQLIGDSDADLRRALYSSEASVASFGTAAVTHMGKATAGSSELRHVSRALGSSLHLVTGESGFMAVELLRTAAALSTMTKAAGGVVATMTALVVEVRAVISSMGILLPLTIAAAAAYEIYTKTIGAAKEAQEANDKAAQESGDKLAASREAVLKALIEEKRIKQQISESDARHQLIALEAEPGIETKTLANRQKASDIAARTKVFTAELEQAKKFESEEYDIRTKLNEAFMAKVEASGAHIDQLRQTRLQRELRDDQFLYDLERKRDEDWLTGAKRKAAALDELTAKRKAQLEALAIEFGGVKPSDLRTGRARQIALLGEGLEEARKKLQGIKSHGFGITSQPLSGFKFGFGAMGSTLGEQKEDKVVEAIKALPREIVEEQERRAGIKLPTPFPVDY